MSNMKDIEYLNDRIEDLESEIQKLRNRIEELELSFNSLQNNQALMSSCTKSRKPKPRFTGKFAKRFFEFCILYESNIIPSNRIIEIVKISRATYYRYQILWKTKDIGAILAIQNYMIKNPDNLLRGLKDNKWLDIRVKKYDETMYSGTMIGGTSKKIEEPIPLEKDEISIGNPYYREGFSVFTADIRALMMQKTSIN